MSETEAGAGEELEPWGLSDSRLTLRMSKDSMEPMVTLDLEVLEAVDMEDSWMNSTSRGTGWASGAGARKSVHGGTKGGTVTTRRACCERGKFMDAAEELLVTLVEMDRVEAFVEGGVRSTAEEWADPNIVLSLRLTRRLNGGIEEGPGFAFE